MSEKRKRQTTVLCTDEVWSRFQALATDGDKTLAVLVGEVIEDELAPGARHEQRTLPPVKEAERTEIARGSLPTRTLIGFGQPVVRVR